MKTAPDVLDVVELREAREGHPAGTVGAVVEVSAHEALVEVVDENGAASDLFSVPFEQLRVRSTEPARRRATG